MKLTRRTDANELHVAYLWKRIFFYCLKMELVHSCQELSNFHIVVWWSKQGPTDVARELATYKERCPQSLREKVLAGVQKDVYTRERRNEYL